MFICAPFHLVCLKIAKQSVLVNILARISSFYNVTVQLMCMHILDILPSVCLLFVFFVSTYFVWCILLLTLGSYWCIRHELIKL